MAKFKYAETEDGTKGIIKDSGPDYMKLNDGRYFIALDKDIEEMHKAETDALQAKIDALMLEYCPDEMTEEQLEEYERNQRAVKVNLDD